MKWISIQKPHIQHIYSSISQYCKTAKTRMWADAQLDGRPAEYRWRPLRKYRNSIPCTTPGTPQSLADGHYSTAVTLAIENKRLGRRVNFAPDKIPLGARAHENVYIVYQPRRRPNILQSFVDFC